MDIQKEIFGQTSKGEQVNLYTLTNSNGLVAKIINYGATLVSLDVPDQDGNLTDVVLGYDSLEEYVQGSSYFGATIGRFGNRIAKGKFTLGGVEYQLATNDGENHLHGGDEGFDKKVWNAGIIETAQGAGVKLFYLSKDGEENYPGDLAVSVVYTLTDGDELKISYKAESDRATVLNLTNHSYFNLADQGNGDILDHQLTLNADKFTPVGDDLIPTGEIKSVKGSPMDFVSPTPIGSRIDQVAGGYDHNYVLNTNRSLSLAASVYEPTSGRIMEVYTTEPAVQFYSGNFLADVPGKSGSVYEKHYGFTLETQHFPDSPNQSNFPSTVLNPDEEYTQETVHKFKWSF